MTQINQSESSALVACLKLADLKAFFSHVSQTNQSDSSNPDMCLKLTAQINICQCQVDNATLRHFGLNLHDGLRGSGDLYWSKISTQLMQLSVIGENKN